MSGKLRMLSAGAGAGKTSRLSGEIIRSIQSGVPPENIMATTFTTKAADELIERVRYKLLESGDAMAAARILDGYVGTMNSVFGRLLREFALEMGLSPVQAVLPETEASTLFRTVASEVIDQYHHQYRQVFYRLQLDGWSESVLRILDLARQNGMNAADIRACADYSWAAMSAWLPEALTNPEELDEALRQALVTAKSLLPGGDTTKATAGVVDTIRTALADWERNGSIPWQQWAKLSKLKPGKSSKDTVVSVIEAAALHDRHPRLQRDMKEVMDALFHCASEAMENYAGEKSKRGLVDFTDQESLALNLLKNPQYEEALKDRISEVFVDEFQDSSPLQIALNMRLQELAQQATWVGDVKQAIYGFRGTDPELMNIAMTSIPDLDVEVLDASYRSRRSLVEFVNAVFVPIFEAKGMSADKIALEPKREDRPEQAPALETWSFLSSKNVKADAASLAAGVQSVLGQADQYLIEDKITRQLRPLRPGDVAILCRANDECLAVAEALSKKGISATVGKSGLLSTPEVVYAVAALRYLVDRKDTLALAELVHFSSEVWGDGRWLSLWLETENLPEKLENEAYIQDLDRVRGKIVQMSPTEVLDLALVVAKVDEVSLSWGQSDQRLANLDRLRSLAANYEETSATNGAAATTSGFLLYLDEVERAGGELNQVADSTDDSAVRVLTYHKAKGLEWPFVILNSLNKSSERTIPPVFNQATAVSTTEFNVEDPLNGRRLYYWPWPYGKQSSNVSLDAYVENAPELKQRKQLLLDENQRLLYVGMTRARDYLVLATRDFTKADWIKELTDAEGHLVLTNLGSTDENSILVRGETFPCKGRTLAADDSSEQTIKTSAEEEFVYIGIAEEPTLFVPARFSPSGQAVDPVKTNMDESGTQLHRIGSRLPLSGNPDMALLGEMVHAFLAADDRTHTSEERLATAQAIRQRFQVYEIAEASMIEAADRLEHFLAEQYPDIVARHSEWPVHLRQGLQKASGWIDLLLDTPKGWVIIDHKTFPGKEADWLSHGWSYLPQLRSYAEALDKASGRPVHEAWIHMPVVGAMINFKESDLKVLE